MGGGKAPKEWVRKYEEENNHKLFDDTKYCPKCKSKTKHINRMCQVCFKINNQGW